MDYLIQIILNGLFLSALYSLMGVAVTLIFGILRIGDFAQGALYAAAGYLTFIAMSVAGLPYLAGAGAAVVAVAALSVIQGHWIYRPLQNISIGATFLGAVGLLVITQNLLALGFSWDPQALSTPWSEVVLPIFGAGIPLQKAIVILAALVASVSIHLFLRHTFLGKALRAVSQNRVTAQLLGVNSAFVIAVAFALAGALSGLAGALMAGLWPLTPYAGSLLVVKAFAIAMIARGKIGPSLLTAMAVGLSESLVQGYWLAELSDLIPFLFLAVILLMRRSHLGPEDDAGRIPSQPVKLIHDRRPQPLKYAALAGFLLLALVVFMTSAPNNQWFHLAMMIGIAIILTSGLDLLTGYTGIPSLCQAGLMGIGSYTSALLALRLGWTFPLTLLGAAVFTMMAAFVIGQIGLRLREHWTSFTFLIGVVITLLIANLKFLTAGTEGLASIPPITASIPGTAKLVISPIHDPGAYLVIVLFFVLLALLLKERLVSSRLGYALQAIREDEALALSIGIPVIRYKLTAFVIAAGFAGIAGSIFAHYYRYLNPDLFTFVQSFNLFVMNVVGGMASLAGPVLGPAALTLFDELTLSINGTIAEIVYGGLLIVALLYLPGGLASLWRRMSITAKRPAKEIRRASEAEAIEHTFS